MSMEYCIDVAGIDSVQTFHQVLAQTLSFPDWYGHNLDALYDCLTELEGCLVLESWDDTADFAQGFREVFADAQEENPDLTVIFK